MVGSPFPTNRLLMLSQKPSESWRILQKSKTSLRLFAATESVSGMILGICTILALVIANSSFALSFRAVLEAPIFNLTVQEWINDGLMTLFFFVVGLEIKRELCVGELSSLKKATLPIAAAVGGMLVPALIYLVFNSHSGATRGWAIPMSTDIAFAVGALTLLGRRVPLSLKIFLLALAIVDDLGAVLVIALFYTPKIQGTGIALLATGLASIVVAKRAGVQNYLVYVLLGSAVWLGTHYSGIHPTISGVFLAFLTPLQVADTSGDKGTISPLNDLVKILHPWVSFTIMPVFALTNAGISLQGIQFEKLKDNVIFLGVGLGLFLGKPIGILLFSYLSVFFGLASFPKGLSWRPFFGVAILSGIGFTMALFITALTMDSAQMIYAKSAILFSSALSCVLGCLWLRLALKLIK